MIMRAAHRKGFTLVELIVAMGIFGFAATTGIASLLALMGVQRKAAAAQDAFDNARYALEFMAKETREARNIENPCLSRAGYQPPLFICDILILHRGRFTPADSENIVTYTFVKDPPETGSIVNLTRKEVGKNYKTGAETDTEWPLTSTSLHMNHGAFYISNPMNESASSNSDEYQPFVIYVMNATAGNTNASSEQSTIHLQTTASLWRLDRP